MHSPVELSFCTNFNGMVKDSTELPMLVLVSALKGNKLLSISRYYSSKQVNSRNSTYHVSSQHSIYCFVAKTKIYLTVIISWVNVLFKSASFTSLHEVLTMLSFRSACDSHINAFVCEMPSPLVSTLQASLG